MTITSNKRDEMVILGIIAVGLITVLLSIIWGLFIVSSLRANIALPNWAENVLVAIATAASLKLGDSLSALVALATGRQVENFGNQLALSGPTVPVAPHKTAPTDIIEAAQDVADQAQKEADTIADGDVRK